MMYILIIGLVAVLVLLIMRISQINEKLACMDEQLSDFVTHKFLNDYMENHQANKDDLVNEVEQLKKRLPAHSRKNTS